MPHIVTSFLFLVMRTFKIYSIINYQIYDTILLILVTLLLITFPGLKNQTLTDIQRIDWWSSQKRVEEMHDGGQRYRLPVLR